MTCNSNDDGSKNRRLSAPDYDRVHAELKRLFASCGSSVNRHDLAIVGIHCCIAEGFQTGPEIIAVLRDYGFNPRHIGKVLHDHRGSDPARHEWERDENGVYRSLR